MTHRYNNSWSLGPRLWSQCGQPEKRGGRSRGGFILEWDHQWVIEAGRRETSGFVGIRENTSTVFRFLVIATGTSHHVDSLQRTGSVGSRTAERDVLHADGMCRLIYRGIHRRNSSDGAYAGELQVSRWSSFFGCTFPFPEGKGWKLIPSNSMVRIPRSLPRCGFDSVKVPQDLLPAPLNSGRQRRSGKWSGGRRGTSIGLPAIAPLVKQLKGKTGGLECQGVAVLGEAVAAAVASTRPSHAAALATVTQLAVTAAAVVYGAFLSPYATGLIGKYEGGACPVPLVFDGVDVTGYKIFEDPEVQKAINFAREAHAGQMRRTGEPYITHCIHTARILAALVPPRGKRAVQTVVAGVLHDVVDDTGRNLNDVREHFGDGVARLVGGVSKLSHINQLLRRHRRINADQSAVESSGLSSAEVDSLRVMLLGMINDPRVVLIKLADRLHNMRTIYALPAEKAHAVAQETLAVWCSLASRLGVWAVKAELEDLCFAVLQPKSFRSLRGALAAMWSPRKDWRYVRRMTKRAKRRALLYGELLDEELEPKPDPEDEEELTMKDLLEAVLPFDVLLDRSRRTSALNCSAVSKDGSKKKTKVVRDAEVALAALGSCEEALDKELLISTSYVPGMEVTLSGRLKSLYSTHCKMKRKGVTLDEVYDARALRVVVGDGGGKLHVAAVEGCYSLLNVVHRLWTPVGGEFDDYVVNPKPSGYQSLHTAVMGPDGAPLEVQIRTQGMHEYAEYGHAAHWLYKEGDSAMKSMEIFAASLPSPGAGDVSSMGDEEDSLVELNGYGKEFKPSRTSGKPLPRNVQIGHPCLRIENGRLLAAVIVRVDDDGRELLVAVSFSLRAREAVAAGRARNQTKRWEAYAELYKKVSDQWWFAPGHGDWSICLEKYTLCSDGMYHKQDQFERALPTFIQLLDLNEREQEDYNSVMEIVQAGGEVQAEPDETTEDDEKPLFSGFQPGVSVSRINNKVRLLRSMLQWEQELRHEAALDGTVTVLNPDHPNSAALTEVLVIRWPDGEIMRMPAGSTASDAARRMGMDGNLVYINSQVALPHMKLKDGDLLEIR
ncbi:hypothetical protein R1flu_000899 [Riccia fluitans]|uniref:GTP diphosphokinase n=1 Tax=Riccia fluitans TaxID=41844 RepID=A0ABD1Y2Q6_9MARC